MRILRFVGLGLLVAALAVTSAGWYFRAHSIGSQKFDSCTYDGTDLVLRYSYGTDSLVSPSMDTRGDRIVVGLRVSQSAGDHRAVGLGGEARFLLFGAFRQVTYADGTPLDCAVTRGGGR